MHIQFIVCFTIIFPQTFPRRTCQIQERNLKYSKVKTCYRSNQVMIASSYVGSLKECFKFANFKKALALNFSPPESITYLPILRKNCEALGCPEIGETNTLIQDLAYDYYSAYSDSNSKY